MNEIKITHELCEADRKRIDDFTAGLGYLAGLLSQYLQGAPYEAKRQPVTPDPDPIADLPEEVKQAEEPAEVKAEDHPVESPFPEAPAEPEAPAAPQEDEPAVTKDDVRDRFVKLAVTKDDVRKLFVKLAAAGKKDQARDIVTAFATSITDLPDAVVSQVYVKLAALGA